MIAVFGFIIYLINRLFYANFGGHGRAVCYATGFIGTPVHELSHAVMCVLFGHRITEMRLFQISDDGTLGYVNHSYNGRNVYQQIGNFFIGVAPIVCISGILYGAAYLLLPSFTSAVSVYGAELSFNSVWYSLKAFFSAATSWQWWVFVLVGMLLALHMNLSGADIKGAWSGVILLLIVVLVVDIVLGYTVATALDGFTAVALAASGYLLCFFTIALIISVFALIISFILRPILNR